MKFIERVIFPADHSADMESSWGDLVEQAERPPGRAVHLHQRLSSPSRKRYVYNVTYTICATRKTLNNVILPKSCVAL